MVEVYFPKGLGYPEPCGTGWNVIMVPMRRIRLTKPLTMKLN